MDKKLKKILITIISICAILLVTWLIVTMLAGNANTSNHDISSTTFTSLLQSNTYPHTSYRILSAEEKEELEKIFSDRNPGWDVTITRFGFISRMTTRDESILDAFKNISIDQNGDTTQLADLSKNDIDQYEALLLKNADLFGINTNDLDLEIITTHSRPRLEVKQQVSSHFAEYYGSIPTISIEYPNHEIPQTEIEIHGHFWPQLNVPSEPLIAIEALKQKIIGTDLTIYPGEQYPCDPIANEPGEQCPQLNEQPTTHTLTESVVNSHTWDPKLDISFWLNDDGDALDLRSTYTLFYYEKPTTSQGFLFIFDAITGEPLAWPE